MSDFVNISGWGTTNQNSHISDGFVIGMQDIGITVGDSGVGQRQLNGTASQTILKWSEYHVIHSFFYMG